MSVVAAQNWRAAEREANAPYTHVALVTPSDTDELAAVTRGISFGVAGALEVVTADGEDVVIPSGALAVGVIHRLAVKQVKAAGTTATGVVAYW